MMEEVDRITLDQLRLLGCDLSGDTGHENGAISSVDQLTSSIIVEATSRCLQTISEAQGNSVTYAHRLPPGMSARFRVGQALASAVKELGYKGEVGYQTFLYPNGKDTRNLLMFLVERLPKEAGQVGEDSISTSDQLERAISFTIRQSLRVPWLPSVCKLGTGLRPIGDRYCALETAAGITSFRSEVLLIPDSRNVATITWDPVLPSVHSQISDGRTLAASLLERSVQLLEQERLAKKRASKGVSPPPQVVATSLRTAFERVAKMALKPPLPAKPRLLNRDSLIGKSADSSSAAEQAPHETREERRARLEREMEELRAKFEKQSALVDGMLARLDELNQERAQMEADTAKARSEAAPLARELEQKQKTASLLPKASENSAHLREVIAKRENKLANLTTAWQEVQAPLLEELTALQSNLRSRTTTTDLARDKLNQLQKEMEEARAEFLHKDEKIVELDRRLTNAKAAAASGGGFQSRNGYTRRILDITENNKKQKVEIARVLGEIMGVQRELNQLRGKLDRTFAETDELVFKDARGGDDGAKKVYKLLADIHENCDQLVLVLVERGRLVRETRELETSIEAETRKMNAENLDKIANDCREMRENNDRLKELIRGHKIRS